MIKVVIISEFSGGGVEKVNTVLAENIDSSQFKVIFISLVTESNAINKNWGFDSVCLNVSSKRKAGKKLIHILKKIHPDVILTCCLVETYFAYFYKCIYSKQAHIIYAQHSVWSKNLTTWKAIFINKYLSKFTGIYNKLDGLVFVSQGVEDDFLQSYGSVKAVTRIIYNPLACNNTSYEFRTMNLKRISLVTVGRIEPEKAQEDIIKAVSILMNKNYDVNLTILGKGSRQRALEELANELKVADRVTFPGFVEDVLEEMRKSDILVLSSLYESFGNVLVEAMNVGLPVISTDCPVGPREILSNGEFGILVPVHDSMSIAEAILKTVEKHSKERVEKAYNRSMDFSIQASIKNYEAFFKELLEEI